MRKARIKINQDSHNVFPVLKVSTQRGLGIQSVSQLPLAIIDKTRVRLQFVQRATHARVEATTKKYAQIRIPVLVLLSAARVQLDSSAIPLIARNVQSGMNAQMATINIHVQIKGPGVNRVVEASLAYPAVQDSTLTMNRQCA